MQPKLSIYAEVAYGLYPLCLPMCCSEKRTEQRRSGGASQHSVARMVQRGSASYPARYHLTSVLLFWPITMFLFSCSTISAAAAHHDIATTVSTVFRTTRSPIDIAVEENTETILIVSFNSNAVYRGFPSGRVQLLAGSTSASGTADGASTAARFHNPYAITYDRLSNVAFISDNSNHRIRRLDLNNNNNVTTIAGNVAGNLNGVGIQAKFNYPMGLTHYGDTLYVADCGNSAVRKVNLSSARVTTVTATPPFCYYLCIDNSGAFLYVTTYSTIVKIDMTQKEQAVVSTMAGNASAAAAFRDGIGADARVYQPQGISLDQNGTALIIADFQNHRIRRLDISTMEVVTIAGNGTTGFVDGRGLRSEFRGSYGSKWYCNTSTTQCGVLVADMLNDAVRFVSLAQQPPSTTTASLSSSLSGGTAEQSYRTFTLSYSTHRSLSHTRSSSCTSYCAILHQDNGGALASLEELITDRSTSTLLQGTNGVVALQGDGSSAAATTHIQRSFLVAAPPLAVNVSIPLGGGTLRAWDLSQVMLDVIPADGEATTTFPLLTATASITMLTSFISLQEQHIMFMVRPPNSVSGSPRWLPTTLSLFRAVTLRLRLQLQCSADPAGNVEEVAIVVASPGVTVALSSEVRAAGTASGYASMVSGPASGSAVGRLASVRSLVLCSSSSTTVNGMLPLPLEAAPDCFNSTVVEAAGSRGAVIGNLVLWGAGAALMALLTSMYAAVARVGLRQAINSIGLPSPLLPLVVVTVPSTVSATFVLLRSACAGDSVIAAVGLIMCTCPLALLGYTAIQVQQRLRPLAIEPDHSNTSVFKGVHAKHPMLVRLLHRHIRWVPPPLPRSEVATVEMQDAQRPFALERVATVIVLEYRVVWYLCVDVAVLTAAGFLGAVSTLGSPAACRGSAVAVAVLYVGQLVLCAAVRPYTTLLSHVHTLFCLALSAVSVWCQVWYLFASARGGADLDALGALLAVAAVCDIVVSAASMLKTVQDLVDALRACHRHVLKALQLRTRSNTAQPVQVVELNVSDAADHRHSLSEPLLELSFDRLDVYEDALEEQYTEGRWWHNDGSAVVRGNSLSSGDVSVDRNGRTDAPVDLLRHHRSAA